jgi:hypothetical protein
MKSPFCENPKCPYHKIEVEPGTWRLSDPPARITRKPFTDKSGRTIPLCEKCYEEREQEEEQSV